MALRVRIGLRGYAKLPFPYRAIRLPFARRAYSTALSRMATRVQSSSRRNFLSGQVIGIVTGELLGSIEVDPATLPRSIAIGSRLPQAAALHFGAPKKNIKARPYLFPAADREQKHFPPIFAAEIEKVWNRAVSQVRPI